MVLMPQKVAETGRVQSESERSDRRPDIVVGSPDDRSFVRIKSSQKF